MIEAEQNALLTESDNEEDGPMHQNTNQFLMRPVGMNDENGEH